MIHEYTSFGSWSHDACVEMTGHIDRVLCLFKKNNFFFYFYSLRLLLFPLLDGQLNARAVDSLTQKMKSLATVAYVSDASNRASKVCGYKAKFVKDRWLHTLFEYLHNVLAYNRCSTPADAPEIIGASLSHNNGMIIKLS